MTKKENQSNAGIKSNSLLQTARAKTFGAGKFALHALKTKSKPKPKHKYKPPVKLIKIPISLPINKQKGNSAIPDERSKISDITASVDEDSLLKRPAVIKEVRHGGKLDDKDIEVESSVLDMSSNSGKSFDFYPTEANKIARSNEMKKKKKKIVAAHQSTKFSSLWPKPVGVSHSPNYLKRKNLVKSSKPINNKLGVTAPRIKTMDISRGLRFSAPAPMTLNRCQLQRGQEKTAPESKEYLEIQAQRQREQQQIIEAEHAAEAKLLVDERLKEEYLWEEEGLDLGTQLNEFTDNAAARKKSLVKKILRKIRPKGIEEKGEAFKAAMTAAAAAIDAALESESNESLSEEKARGIAKKALTASKKKKKRFAPNFLQQSVSRTDQIISNVLPISAQTQPTTTSPPSTFDIDGDRVTIQEIVVDVVDSNGGSLYFPVKEVMMESKKDSMSDLDASVRNSRKVPVAEIHMNDAEQASDDESVSTLGTPRIFDQLDKLLSTESNRHHQLTTKRMNPNDGTNQHVWGGSAAPPPMVTSHDAKALIDQADSGTMIEDTTIGTSSAENVADAWRMVYGCSPLQQTKELLMEASALNNVGLQKENNKTSNRVRARIEEINSDSIEISVEGNSSHEEDTETAISPTSAFSFAIDNSIRKAEMEIATGYIEEYERNYEELPLSPIVEVDEVATPNASIAAREAKTSSYLPIAPGVLKTASSTFDSPEINNKSSQPSQQPVSFDKLMNIAVSKLDMTTEHTKGQHQHDKYSTEIDDSPRKDISGEYGVNKVGRDVANEATPRIRGGFKNRFFETTDDPPHFSDSQFDLLLCEKNGRTENDVDRTEARIDGDKVDNHNVVHDGIDPVVEDIALFDAVVNDNNVGGIDKEQAIQLGEPKASIAVIEEEECQRHIRQAIRQTRVPEQRQPHLEREMKIHQYLDRSKKEKHSVENVLGEDKNKVLFVHDLTQVDSKECGHIQTKFIPLSEMDQGRFLLEKDDAYWDTLSTIASTTNDRSSESDEYMDEFVPPGPIPDEITTSNSESQTKGAFVTIRGKLLPPSPEIMPPPLLLNQKSGCKETSRVPDAALITIYESSQDSTHNGNASGKDTPGGNISLFNEGGCEPEEKLENPIRSNFATIRGKLLPPSPEITRPPLLKQKSGRKESSRVPEADLVDTLGGHVSLFNEGSGEPQEKIENRVGFSRSKDNVNDMITDVTSLIDADLLLDRSPASNTRNSTAYNNALFDTEKELVDFDVSGGKLPMTDGSQKSSTSSHKMISPMKTQPRLCPEISIDRSINNAQNKNAIPPIRSVSWGFEEIYEDCNSHFDQSGQETSNSEGTSSLGDSTVDTRIPTSQPSSEDMRSSTKPELLPSNEALVTGLEQQDLLSRTLELSKGLLENIMGKQDIKEHEGKERTEISRSRNAQANHASQHTPQETRDDVHYQENRSIASNVSGNSEDNLSLKIRSKLETLRKKRSQALSKFQLSRTPISEQEESNSRSTAPKRRDRDRLKYYTTSHNIGNLTNISSSVRNSDYSSSDDTADIELKYTTSDSDLSTTPSQKARDLRIQLDEALKASKEIQLSQLQLGSELRTFKSRYYNKNDKIEQYARKAINRY